MLRAAYLPMPLRVGRRDAFFNQRGPRDPESKEIR